MPARPAPLPEPQARLLAELGERLRKARLRRRITVEAVAREAGIARMTLYRVESGDAAVTIGTVIKVMGAMGLASDVALLGRDDKAGRLMQDEQLPRRRKMPAGTGRKLGRRIRIDRYPQLKQIAWHLSPTKKELEPEEAFALYERNWRHIDQSAMPAQERELVKKLTDKLGKGVLLV
jgi:transcriptional regulator with XRE-family HTH domain